MKKAFAISLAMLISISLLAQQIDSVKIAINPCIGAKLASIEVFVSGGVPPYEYTWAGPSDFASDQQNIYDLFAGIYTLKVKDSEGTPVTDPNNGLYLIDDPDPITISIDTSSYNGFNVSCHGCFDGWIKITGGFSVNGDFKDWTYRWTDPKGFTKDSISISNLPAGWYTLEMWDTANCYHRKEILLTEPDAPIYSDTITVWDTLHITVYDTVYQFTSVAEQVSFIDFQSGQTLTVINYGEYLTTDRIFNSAVIYDLTGSKIKQFDLSDKISVSDLEAGIYLFIFELDVGIVFREKIYIE